MPPGRPALRIAALLLPLAVMVSCNEVATKPVGPGASPEVQAMVAQIDALLVVPQERYVSGDRLAAHFEELHELVSRQPHSLRTVRVAQNMGYFIAHGNSIGWHPQESEVARVARDWQDFREEVLAGP